MGAVSTDTGTEMNVIKAHGLLGHINKDSTRQTAKHLGWIIARGKLKPFVQCAKLKAKQKNVCKSSQSPKAIEPGGRVYFDLTKSYSIEEQWLVI